MSDRKCRPPADPGRRRFLALPLIAILAASPAWSAERYSLDQKVASIAFSVSHLGLFSSQGRFRRFDASLLLDIRHPERTRVSVAVDAASVDMPWQEGAAMLRSTDFFDVRQYPWIRFTSTSVEAVAPDRYVVRGRLALRGVTQPLVLHATLADPDQQAGVADFVATGTLQRSAFGMTADAPLISDTVRITIDARIRLAGTVHAG